MALKDWKKTKTRIGLSKWINDYGIWIYVTSTKNIRQEKIYGVDSNHPNFYSNMQFFETNSQALKFARAYMRKH